MSQKQVFLAWLLPASPVYLSLIGKGSYYVRTPNLAEMPMDLTGLFQNLGAWAIAVLGLTYFLRKIFEKWMSQSLESFKARLTASHDAEIERLRADLRTAAFERETRFARLHERRAKVIAELYKCLVWAHTSLLEFIQPIQQGGEEERKERGKKAADNTNKFFAYFHENYIYFDQSLCAVISTLEEKFRRTWAEFAIFPDMKPASAREWADAWKSFSQDAPPLRHEIEKRFRRMLGVEDE